LRRSHYGLVVWVCIAVAIGLGCSENKGIGPEPVHYGISPDSVDVQVSSAQQFTATFQAEPLAITWYVNGVRGGTPRTGMITPDGLFVAPYEPPPAGYVTITAEAELDSIVRESAKAVIESGYGATIIVLSPDSAVVAAGDSVEFSPTASGCALTDPLWSVVEISGEAAEIGTMRPNGIYVAPTAVSSDFALIVTVASLECADKVGIGRIAVMAPEPFIVQLEDFTDSYGSGINKTVPCSGGYAVNGLDWPGEWIEVPYEVPVGGSYTAEIHYAAGVNDVLTVTVQETMCSGSPAPQEVTFEMAQGNGLG
jgi:hypothetical protein